MMRVQLYIQCFGSDSSDFGGDFYSCRDTTELRRNMEILIDDFSTADVEKLKTTFFYFLRKSYEMSKNIEKDKGV